MAAPADHYATLGVAPYSDDVVIRAAYKALMLKYHPDTNGGRDTNERAAAINAAFAILGDPVRRAAFDANRQPRSAPMPPPPAPPSPPNSPPSSAVRPDPDGADSQPVRSGLLRRIGGTLLLALVVGGVRLAFSPSSASEPVATADNTMVADMNATEGMDTMSNAMTAVDPGSNGGIMANDSTPALGNTLAVDQSPNLGPVAALNFDDIEGATQTFEHVLEKSGMFGARAYSENCHKKVQVTPAWAAADRCAAFDYAAHYLDVGYAKASNMRTLGYFDFQAESQADQYSRLGASVSQVNERLARIKKAVEPATYEALEAGLQRRKDRETTQDTTPSQPDGGTLPNNEHD